MYQDTTQPTPHAAATTAAAQSQQRTQRTQRTPLPDSSILQAIESNPGSTAKQLGALLQLSDSAMAHRLRNLLKQQRIVNIAHGSLNRQFTLAPTAAAQAAPAAAPATGTAPQSMLIRSNPDIAQLTPAIDSSYIVRSTDATIIKLAQLRIPILLIGEAGTGKTKAAEQYAATARLPFLRIACDDSAVLKEFIGTREIVNGTTYWRSGQLIELMQQPCVILFDEFNALAAGRLFFLHEILDHRRIFVKDDNGGRIVNLHPDCILMLACNPNSAKYSGTNKVNAALADRCATVPIEALDIKQFNYLFNCGTKDTNDALRKFYKESCKVIEDQNLRLTFSLRALQRCHSLIKSGMQAPDAVRLGFYNTALVTASSRELESLASIAQVIFPTDETATAANITTATDEAQS